ncbi:MAG: hypothetical protein P1U87_01810 [Verrucomicrobiales bacterium]|nr:hypothetical protein [Verrucomicrobiales bacterium]
MKDDLENSSNEPADGELIMQKRRNFLAGLGKWSGAATMAAVGGAAWVSSPGTAQAGWLNRRIGGGWINGRGGGWVNGRGGGGSWVNRGGGGWVNRRGGGGWINRR